MIVRRGETTDGKERLGAERVRSLGRDAVLLTNGRVRAVIDLEGGMMPEFSIARGPSFLNAHWVPVFRDASGGPWDRARHETFWKSTLLRRIAGDFPCCPSFGPGCSVDGAEIPPHGWTADEAWELAAFGVDEDAGAAWADFRLESPEPAMPISWRRLDILLAGQPVYYTVLAIRNPGPRPVSVNVGRHNTLGPPFLAAGCRISLCADRFATAPEGGEFDDTGRLVQGAEFAELDAAPLRSGGRADISRVPGMIGFTDFVTGAVPRDRALGWSCVLNPDLGLAYACFFPGPAGTFADEIALSFNDLWMQYGGRRFTPWAETEGGEDRCFCLGTENATGAYAKGLAWARAHPSLLGSPTLVDLPAGGERRLLYGAAFLEPRPELLREGILGLEQGKGRLVAKGRRCYEEFTIDADFRAIRALAARTLGGGPC
jgi:hypothetical protein